VTKELIADIIAIGGAMIGSFIIAMNLGLNMYGYIAFIFSGIATLYHYSISETRNSLKFIVWFYLVIDIIGIIRY
jgi:hypothetical protein